MVVAGPNGAGKSTTSRALIRATGVPTYINPDLIATGLSPLDPGSVSFSAGRMVLSLIREYAQARHSFAFETTLSGRTYATILRELQQQDYQITLLFLWLPSAEAAVARVAERVRGGGHHIPEESIRRRYRAGLENFFRFYADLVNDWKLIDNSGESPQLIAQKSLSGVVEIEDKQSWEVIREQHAR